MATTQLTKHIRAPRALVYENLPPGVSPADNELGWSMSLDKLASLVENRR
ncbi:MAG TPA: hypothetical protein VF482_20365 [Trebonia sp.]